MPNPILSWLRGDDLKQQAPETPTPQPLEQKLYFLPASSAIAIRSGMLAHGPWATQMIDAAWGYGKDNNSAVFACLTAICTAYPEAPLKVWQVHDPSSRDWLIDSPLQQLLDHPNPYMSGPNLWWWTQWVKHVDGNAYWRKIRSGHPTEGNVVELWPVSPKLIIPWREKDSKKFIDSYRYQFAPGKYEFIPVENIVHFRLGMDDLDHRLGCAPLKRLVAEVLGDDLAAEWQATMLNNGGAAGMVVQVPAESSITEDQAIVLKANISAAFGHGNQGRVGVLTGGATMEQYGFSPEQMDMKALHRVPEERISAVLRVPAIIAGLGAGLDRSTFANFKEAREMFAEMTILPLYGFDAATINSHLLPDFTNDRAITTAFDISGLRALQEDGDALWKRVTDAWNAGLLTLDQALNELGHKPAPGMDGNERKAPTPAIGAPAPAALPPGQKSRVLELKAGQVSAETLQALIELAEPGLTEELSTYFDQQRRRVKRALVSGQ